MDYHHALTATFLVQPVYSLALTSLWRATLSAASGKFLAKVRTDELGYGQNPLNLRL